jgi:hypothetical protein
MPDNRFGFAGQLLRTVYLSLLLAEIPYYFNNLGGEMLFLDAFLSFLGANK